MVMVMVMVTIMGCTILILQRGPVGKLAYCTVVPAGCGDQYN